MAVQNIQIDLDHLFLLTRQASNRASYFGAICQKEFKLFKRRKAWAITQENNLSYALNRPDKKSFKNILLGLENWTLINLVRDVIESFLINLNSVYHIGVLLLEPHINQTELNDRLQQFHQDKVDAKILKLKSIGIKVDDTNHRQLFKGLVDIRNCLSHNLGIISGKEGEAGPGGTRNIQWYVIEMYLRGAVTGKKRKMVFNQELKEASHVVIQFSKKSRNFKIGEQIRFTPAEVWEISDTVNRFAADIKQQLVVMAKELGKFTETPPEKIKKSK